MKIIFEEECKVQQQKKRNYFHLSCKGLAFNPESQNYQVLLFFLYV